MWKFLALYTALAVMNQSEAGHAGSAGEARAGGYAGGYGGGYVENYAGDYDDSGFVFPGEAFAFGGGITNPFAFHQQLMANILRQHAAHQNAIVSAVSSGGASVNAGAEFTSDNDYLLLKRRIGAPNTYYRGFKSGTPSGSNGAGGAYGYGGPMGSTGGGNFQGAAASASIGSQGGHQSASIFPENPNVPNFNTRFGGSGGDGYKGVSVSVQSSSQNINGKPVNTRRATTVVNDNGKISTHTVHS